MTAELMRLKAIIQEETGVELDITQLYSLDLWLKKHYAEADYKYTVC